MNHQANDKIWDTALELAEEEGLMFEDLKDWTLEDAWNYIRERWEWKAIQTTFRRKV